MSATDVLPVAALWPQVRTFLVSLVGEIVAGTPTDFSVDVMNKGHQDYVTSLDLYYQETICKALRAAYPAWPIIAEEDDAGASASQGHCWIVDPLDGTFNFAHSLPFYGISIALMHDGVPCVAAVYDFAHRCVYSASAGGGAFVADRPMTAVNSSPHRAIAVSSGVVDWALAENPSLLVELRKLGRLRILGSQGCQLAYVGAGHLSANLSVEAKAWDDAAGALIVKESGAHYSNFAGGDIFPLPESGNAHTLTLQSVACEAALWPLLKPLLHSRR